MYVFYLFNVCVIFFVCHCYVNTCVVVFVFIFLSFTNTFCLLNLQKIAKKESQSQVHFVVFFVYFGMNVMIFLFTPMHVLNFLIWICVLCFTI